MPQDSVIRPDGPQRVIVMDAPPGLPGLFFKMAGLSLVRPVTLPPKASLENLSIVQPLVTVDPGRVHAFRQVCGYEAGSGTVPAAFIQSMLIGIMSRFICSPFFPVSPMGLIQIAQSFEVIRPVSPDQKLDLFCRMLDMTRTEKGLYSRFLMEAAPACNSAAKVAFSEPEEKKVAWQGIATYLTRSKAKGSGQKKRPLEESYLPVMETIDVPENTGRRYARVSRDVNPHHLYTWTARLIGFKQPIAHGIWSMARACASLEKAAGFPSITWMQGSLKRPIFMPSQITLGYTFTDNEAQFELRNKATGAPHLKGCFGYSHTSDLPAPWERKK